MKRKAVSKVRLFSRRMSCCVISAAAIVAGTVSAESPPSQCVGIEHIACDGPFTNYDFFGNAAISGIWAIIGRRYDSTGYYYGAGAVYFYKLVHGQWVKHSKLTAPYPDYQDYLGDSVAIDGNRAVAAASRGGPNSQGMLVVFERELDANGDSVWSADTTLWVEDGSDGDDLGGNVHELRNNIALSGNLIAAGAHNGENPYGSTPATGVGYVAVFRKTLSGWEGDDVLDWRTFAPADPATEGWFGAAVAIEGERMVIGEPRREGGRVYVAQRVGGSWQLEQIINAPGTIVDGELGYSVALESNRLAVGARERNEAFVYEHDGNSWVLTATLTPNVFGSPVSFGQSIAMNGPKIVVGDHEYNPPLEQGNGAAFVFQLGPYGTWTHVRTLIPENVTVPGIRFGDAVSLKGSEAIVGSLRNLAGGANNVGAAYAFTLLPLCDSYDPACLSN